MRRIKNFYRVTLSVALLLTAVEGNAVLAETAKGNVKVKAPFVTVDGAGTKVKAPFVDYDSTGGANVKAPFVNVGNGQVKAPFVNLTTPGAQTGAAGQSVPPLTPSTQTVSPNDAMGLSGAPGNPLASPNQFPQIGAPATQLGAQGTQLGAPGQTTLGTPAGQLAPGQTGQPTYLGQPAGTGLSNFLGKFINIENSPTGGIHVKAPFVDVNTGSGVDVKAPFVDVHQ